MKERFALPIETLVALLLIVGGALTFFAEGVVRWLVEGVSTDLTLPVVIAAFETAVAAGVLARMRAMRIIGVGVLAMVVLVHLLIALGGGPWWARAISGMLVVVGCYAAVLLNTGPVRHYLGNTR